jgi:hypothetical protein
MGVYGKNHETLIQGFSPAIKHLFRGSNKYLSRSIRTILR